MARLGCSITKSTSFRGVAQEFSNTYYYEYGGVVGEGAGISLIDALVALEKPIHASSVTFVRGRCWTAGGTNAQNTMIAQKALSGTGTNAGSLSSVDKERAFLVRFRAGNDSRGNPVYLRKWWHLDLGAIASTTISNDVGRNIAQLPQAVRDQLVTWADQFKSVTVSGLSATLVAESGRGIDGATQAHPYLEHHQLGDMWRT